MTNATATVVEHILARLRSDQTLVDALPDGAHGIVEGTAPEGAAYPLVLVQSNMDPDTTSYNGGTIAYTAAGATVRVVAPAADIGALVPLAQRVTGTLHATRGTYSTGDVASCQKVGETSMVEERGGRTWRYLGDRYSLLVS